MGRRPPLIAGLGGTLRTGSLSRAALAQALAIAAAEGADTHLLDLGSLHLPMYLPDAPLEAYGDERAAVEGLVDMCRRADALIWASPTYHGTVAGVVKNAIDMLELLAGDDPPYLTGKPIALIAIADSTPLIAMASSVHELRAWTAPTRVTLHTEDFTEQLELNDGAPTRRVTRLVRELLSFCRTATRG